MFFGKSLFDDVHQLPDQVLGLDELWFTRHTVDEPENLAHQTRAALDAAFDAGENPLVTFSRQAGTQQRDAHENRSQDVVEVVGDAGGEHPDVFQPLDAEHLFLGGATLLLEFHLVEGTLDGGNQPLRTILDDVVAGPGAERFQGAVLADGAGEEDERNLGDLLMREVQGFKGR